MKENDSVLIHAGGSGVGTAAVQLVKLVKGELNTPCYTNSIRCIPKIYELR